MSDWVRRRVLSLSSMKNQLSYGSRQTGADLRPLDFRAVRGRRRDIATCLRSELFLACVTSGNGYGQDAK